MRGSERVERCTTTKYDDAAVGTRLTPSKNDRRCLPCFLRASQFPTSLSSWSFLAAGISRCRSLRPAPNSRRGYARHSRDIVAPREYTGCSVIDGARWARDKSICRNNFFPDEREREKERENKEEREIATPTLQL